MNFSDLKIFELPPQNALYAVIGILIALVLASLIVYAVKKSNPQKDYTELVLRTRSWWYILAFFCMMIFGGRFLAISCIYLVSYFALKEYFALVSSQRLDRRVRLWAYFALIGQFYFTITQWYTMFLLFIPVYAFLLLPFRMILVGETQDYLKRISTIQWGLLLTVFSFGHIAYLFNLDQSKLPMGHAQGLLIYVVALTQFNDVAQYCWGKALGKKKIVPKISPNKTWAGFLGGIFTTMVLSALIAPYLTPMTMMPAMLCGALIGASGFIGDVNISALKRDIGVKDSGNSIPGHGGILDRVDSLTFTAPIFFHVLSFFYF